MPQYVHAPNAASFGGADFSWLANLPSQFYQGAAQKQDFDKSQAFKNGLPLNPDGTVNYSAMMQTLAKYGDTQDVPKLAQLAQQQQQSQAIGQTDPLDIAHIQTPQTPQSTSTMEPSAPMATNPPASAGLASPTRYDREAPASGKSNGGGQPPASPGTGATVDQLISRSLPNAGEAGANIAKALTAKLKVDPNAPLTPDQQRYADSVISGYAARSGVTRQAGDGLLANGGMRAAAGLPPSNDPIVAAGERVASIESGGKYNALGPVTSSGDRAYGRYGVMGANIPEWTKEVLGKSMTPQEFLKDKSAQDQVFRAKFGSYVEKTGNVADAASMWLTGRTLANGGANAADQNGTTGRQYAANVAGGDMQTGRSASVGPQGQGGPQPLVPQVPLPKGFTDPQEAILALREKAAQYGSKYGSNPAADYNVKFWNAWADRIENSISPMKVGRYDSYVDPRTGKTVYDGAASGSGQVVQGVVDAIANGDQPPTLTGLYGQSAAVRSGLEKKGFNLANAQLQWQQAQKQVATLNGPQMTRFVGLATSVTSTIDEVRDLSQQMEMSGIPLLNKAELTALAQTQGNTQAGQLAARYMGAVNTLKEEFANLAQGGYAPTEAVWKLANDQVNGEYGVKQLGASLDEIQRLIKYRVNAIPNIATMGPGSANRYTGNSGQNAQGGAPASPAPAPVRVSTPEEARKLPSGTPIILPDGSHGRVP